MPRNCYKGFERLISEQGYRTEKKKCDNYSDILQSINNGIPVFITSTDYYFTTGSMTRALPAAQSVYGNYETRFIYVRSHGVGTAHTFIGYGYAYYTFDQNNTTTVSEFIKVADGWKDTCYFNYALSKITDVASINVYK